MNIESLPRHAMEVLDGHDERSRSPEHKALFRIASGAMAFIAYSGQLYRFEQFLRSRAPDSPRAAFSSSAVELLERTRASATSPEEQEVLLATIAALEFVESSGQHQGLEEYLHRWEVDTLPPVVAAFKTEEEANTWLDGQSVPPYSARVLIGDGYHTVLRSREGGSPNFLPMQTVAAFIESHSRGTLPPVVASFQTRAEADAWWASQPAPPTHVFITVGGAHYLAVYQENVQHRALYPFSLADEWVKAMRDDPE